MIRATSGQRGKVRRGHVVGGVATHGFGPQTAQTWDPTLTNASITFSNGNLTSHIIAAGARCSVSTGSKSNGKYYAEILIGSPFTQFAYIGTSTTGSAATGLADGRTWRNDGVISTGGSANATFTANDVLGLAFDMNAGTIVCYKNNAVQATNITGMTGARFIAFQVAGGAGDAIATIRTTEAEFSYAVPGGYVPWGAA